MPRSGQYWRLLARYLRAQRSQVIQLVVLVIGEISLLLLNPQLVRRFLDAVDNERSLNNLITTAATFTLIAVLAQVFRVRATYVGQYVAWTATNELRADLAYHCLKLEMSFHKAHKPGQLIERVDGDVNKLANFFSQLVIELSSNLILLIGVSTLLWLVDWRIGLSISCIAFAGMLVLNKVNKRVVPLWQALRQVEADLFGYLEEWLGGTEEIQSNYAAEYILRRLIKLLRLRWRSMQKAMRMELIMMGLPVVVPALAYIAAYLWGDVLFRNTTMSIGSIYLIFYYIDVVKGPLWGIQRQVQDLQRASASLNRTLSLFEQQPLLDDGAGIDIPKSPLSIHFQDVAFHYEDDPDTEILRDISFELEAGKVLGLLGRTGSGKTTLTRLLLRFYDPSKGSISIGNQSQALINIQEADRTSLRTRVGMVTQDVELFHATVRDNITLFDETIDDERIMMALEELGLSNWLSALPDGLDSRLEAGKSLSAGEAQLLALGRVFLADAGLVILDEASSRLDPATEQLLEMALTRLLKNRTAIIVAHRLTTVNRADEIMILSNGSILEHGERFALLNNPDSHLCQLMSVGMEETLA